MTLKLPTEIVLTLLAYLSTTELSLLRSTNRHIKQLVDWILVKDFKIRVSALHLEYKHAHTKYVDRELAMKPHLRHYKSFLTQISMLEVNEAMWYASPPSELQTVCECLCLLFEPENSEHIQEENNRMSWLSIRKTMGKYEFKQWVQALSTNAHKISFKNAKIVEKMIAGDSSITYERLRNVSLSGYKLLIYVAACLQYCTISQDLKTHFNLQEELSTRLNNSKNFLSYL